MPNSKLTDGLSLVSTTLNARGDSRHTFHNKRNAFLYAKWFLLGGLNWPQREQLLLGTIGIVIHDIANTFVQRRAPVAQGTSKPRSICAPFAVHASKLAIPLLLFDLNVAQRMHPYTRTWPVAFGGNGTRHACSSLRYIVRLFTNELPCFPLLSYRLHKRLSFGYRQRRAQRHNHTLCTMHCQL